MDTGYLSALAALTGTAVGGLTSFFSSRLAQDAQFKAQLFLHDKGRRQELYRDFVDEASELYIDALNKRSAELAQDDRSIRSAQSNALHILTRGDRGG